MDSLPRLSLPPFYNTTYDNHIGRIMSHRKHIPEENSTYILGKISNIYLEDLRQGNAKDGNFIKCNYLEELVKADGLNYMSVSFYYSQVVYSIKTNTEKKVKILIKDEEELYNSINNEEIPIHFLVLCNKYGWELMYDYHVILQVQKFAPDHQVKDPLFSTFVLLKPTCKVISYCIFNESCENLSKSITSDKNVLRQTINRYESLMLFNTCPPMYLGTDQAVLKYTCFQELYHNPFVSSLLNSHIKQIGVKTCVIDNKRDKHIQDKYQEFEKCEKEKCEKEKCVYFVNEDPKAHLLTRLKSRTIFVEDVINEENCDMRTYFLDREHYHLAEIFTFEYKEKIEKAIYQLRKDEIIIYVKDGSFCTLLRNHDLVTIPDINKHYWYFVPSKEILDMYILSFAIVVSKKFTSEICIKYKTSQDSEERLFFHFVNKDILKQDELEYFQELSQKSKLIKLEEQSSKDNFSDSSKDVLSSNRRDSVLETHTSVGDSVTQEFQSISYEGKDEGLTESLTSFNEKEIEFTSMMKITFSEKDLWNYEINASLPFLKKLQRERIKS